MDEREKLIKRLVTHDPATLTDDMFTKEEWAILQEHHNEMAMKVANMESIQKWVMLTNLLPDGLLSSEEKVAVIRLVMSRFPKDLK